MKITKIKRIISSVLVASIFLSNVAYAEELVDTEATIIGIDATISYGVDKVKNIVAESFSFTDDNDPEEDEVEVEFQDPGMDLTQKDIQALYDIGYDLPDIEEAIKMSVAYEKTPYELLQIKGQKNYVPHEVTGDAVAVAETEYANETTDESNGGTADEQPDYEFTVEENSWDSVVMDLHEGNIDIDENQWDFIKLSGVDQYIDQSMLSEEEKAELADAGTENDEAAIELYSVSGTPNITEIYNNYIFPTSVHEQVQQGGYINSDDVYVNELTGNNIVKETDVSLAGRNGLDLNLTRYYSITDANNHDATVYKASGSDTYKTNTYYSVSVLPYVTIYYNEPLPNGKKSESHYINEVYIAPGRTNYNKNSSFKYGMFVSGEAYKEDIARLSAGEEPMYLFTSQADAERCISLAESGKYDYNIRFNSAYQSKIASVKFDLSYETATVRTVGTYRVRVDGSSYYNDVEDSSHSEYFDIGYGWSFDFPYIEKRYNSTDKVIYEYLHMGSGGVWQIEDNELVGYFLKDMQLSNGSGSINGEYCDYLLTEKSGKKYYFGSIGQLLCIEDRYGNRILFEYDKFKDGRITYPKLKKITDTVGRVIDITYPNNTKVLITVTDKNDSSQNRTIEYGKTDGKLISVKNAEGYTTTYGYYDVKYNVSMVSKDKDSPSKITYSCLENIYYPTGMMRELWYSKLTKNCGTGGTMEIPICTGNVTYETDAEGNTTERTRDLYSRDRGTDNVDAVYDGYPTFKSLKEVPQDYRVYAVHTSKIDQYVLDPLSESSIYALSKYTDGNWLKESVVTEYEDFRGDEDSTDTYKAVTEYEYNRQDLCTKETTRTYNDFDNDKQTYITTTKEYTYDTAKYGDILSEKINGQTNRTTSYVYDSTYHIPTKVTYKKDNNTTIVANYTLTSDKKAVDTVTLTENNSTKRKRSYSYDSYGNVVSEKRYSGNNSWNDYIEISYDYNDSRNVNNKINGVYLNKVSVSGIKDADGATANGGTVSQSYTYDWYGNTLSETDANGNKYQYAYDKINRITKITNPDASTQEYTFTVNTVANDVTVKDANGGVIKYSYDQFGRALSETDVNNNVLLAEHFRDSVEYHYAVNDIQYSNQNEKTISQKAYNAAGDIIEENILDANNTVLYHSITDYEFAVDGIYSKIINTVYGDTDNETIKNITYTDEYGNVVKEEVIYKDNGTDKSAVTEYTYDLLGNCLTVREPRANEEGWTANEYTVQYEYDVAGNVTKETDINGNSITNTYDGLGNLISVKDKNGNTTTNTYDVLGRILEEKIPFQKNGTSTVYASNKYYYDANGNLTKSKTANNAVGSGTSYTTTEYAYNWQNQPTKVRGFNGSDVESCVQYYYDSVGNVLRMYTGDVDSLKISGLDNVSGSDNYAVTKYTYDSMNRCVSQTDALGQTVSNIYDINGNLTQSTDRNGNILSYSYDSLNQLLSKSSSKTDADTYAYTYNKKGNRISMTGGGVDTISVYDNLGRLTKESLTDGIVKEYTYDANGNRKSFKLTKDNVVQYILAYTYDKQNRLIGLWENNSLKAQYTYNNDGTLKHCIYGTRTTDYTYNLAQLVTEVKNKKSSSEISTYDYTYYVDGNQKSKSESVSGVDKGITNYTYDGLNRLVKEQAPNKTYSYQYDSYGNRSQLSVTGDEKYTTSYTYDKNNRMRNQTKTAGSVREITDFWYDPNGNQISSMTVSTGGTDTPGVGIEPAGGRSNSINEYDSWNQLTKTMQNGTTASYTYNGDGLRMSKTVDGTTTNHIWDGTNIAGDVTNGTVTKYIRGLQLISAKNGSNENFYNYNGHGDVVQLTNSTGTITKQYSYDAFGVEIDKDDTDINPFRYCGEYFDTETNSIYLRARYYAPVIGRFITEDPICDGLNWYMYCRNNSTNYIDPSGLDYIPLRSVIEGLGGYVNWNPNNGIVTVGLDGNTITVYDGDAIGTYNENGTMYVWDEYIFPMLAVTFDLGKGWSGRIERNTSGGNYGMKHVHVYNSEETYAQNEDGSPHDGSKGGPPRRVKKELKNKKNWDWDEKENSWINKIDVYMADDSGVYIIQYPNGRRVAYYNYSFFRVWRPSKDDLKELSSGPIYVNKSAGIYYDFYVPYIDGIPMPIIESVPIYAY